VALSRPPSKGELPPIEEQIAFYDKWNKENRTEPYEIADAEIKARTDKILEFIDAKRLPTDEILEIGCGTGWFSEKLTALGTVTAIDLSPQSIKIARGRSTKAQFIAANVLDHDFGGRQFDLIVCVEALFYVQDPDLLVRKMFDLCRDGGHLALTTINKFVYERSEGIKPPEKGQIRNWMSRGATRDLIQRFFDITFERTVAPRGHQGILRLVNSYRLNHLMERFVSKRTLDQVKCALGLGGGIVFIARKRSSITPSG
jgi:SAM-dependent methyltransferase